MKRILSLLFLMTFIVGINNAQVNRELVTEMSGLKSVKKENARMIDVRQQLQKEMRETVSKARQTDPDAFNPRKLQKIQAHNFQVGTQHSFWARNFRITNSDDEGYFYPVPATCRAVSDYAYVFVEDASWNSSYANQNSADVVSNAFSYSTPADPNKGIYDIDTEVFGFPFDVDNDQRIIILILDIQDNYGIDGNNSYTGGYNHVYNSFTVAEGATYSNEMEMFYQDSHPADAMSEDGLLDIGATLAHEFQHMIEDGNHYLVNGLDQETFFDEGCSETASVVCGYPGRSSDYYATETNRNLVSWRSGSAVLGDYERAFRFMLYMYEQFGSDFLTKFISAKNSVGNPQVGFSAFNIALPTLDTPTSRRQKDIIWDWHIASNVENKSVNSKWGFDNSAIGRVKGEEFGTQSVTVTSDTVQSCGAIFLNFSGGSNITANFTFANQYATSFAKIYAVKGSGATAVVDEVTANQDVTFSDYGTAYTSITFIVSNSSTTSRWVVDYSITGEQPTEPIELAYDENAPLGTFTDAVAGDKMAVSFNGVANGKLRTIKAALRTSGSINARVYKYTGLISDPLGDPLCDQFTVTGITTPDAPYPDPWTNWVNINMESENISTNEPFIISFEYIGDNNVMVTSTPGMTFSHSHSYDSADDAWKWYVNSNDNITYLYMIRAVVEFEHVNELPVLGELPDSITLDFAGTTAVVLSATDSETAADDLVFTAESSNDSLEVFIAFDILAIAAHSGFTGEATVDITVEDEDGGTDTGSITVTVLPENMPPELGELPELITLDYNSNTTVSLTATDDYSPADSLLFSAESSNDSVAVSINQNNLLIVSAISGFVGDATITIIVEDEEERADTGSINVIVNAENMPPELGELPELITLDYNSNTTIALTASDDYTPADSLVFSAVSSNDSVAVSINRENVLIIAALPGFNGEVTVTITVEDEAGEIDTFIITVLVNPDPTEIDISSLPTEFKLYQNYPNPFNPTTTIKYAVAENAMVKLKVYDVLGKEIKTLVNTTKSVGNYEIIFNANNLPSGIYYYTIRANNFVQTRKMIMLK